MRRTQHAYAAGIACTEAGGLYSRRVRKWVSTAAAIAMLVGATATPAVATTPTGVLDTSFNGTGKVAIGSPWTTGLMAPAPHNGVYLALEANNSGAAPIHLTRLTTAGTPDPTFGSGGHADVDLGNGGRSVPIALVPDGDSLLVLATNTANHSFGLVRLTASGGLDPTFGSGGRVVFPPASGSTTEGIEAGHVLSDGRIELVLVRDEQVLPHAGGFDLMRLRANGSSDPTLAPYGIKNLVNWSSVGDGPNSTPGAAFTGDGKVYVTLPYGSGGRTTIDRFATNGVLDTSFNRTGARPYGCPDWQHTIDGPRLRVDLLGRPLLFCTINSSYDVFVARLTTVGAADSTFGSDGHFRAWIHTLDEYSLNYGIDDSDRVAFGYLTDDDSPTVLHLTRFTSAGSLDATFGTSGASTITFGPDYDMNSIEPTFGTHRMYMSLYPNEAPSEVDIAVTA